MIKVFPVAKRVTVHTRQCSEQRIKIKMRFLCEQTHIQKLVQWSMIIMSVNGTLLLFLSGMYILLSLLKPV